MTTPGTVPSPSTTSPRLAMTGEPGRGGLHGGWWPATRDLATELSALVAHLDAGHGRVVRAVFSPPDWDARPHRISTARGPLKVGSFPRDDTHLMLLRMSDGATLRLLVVPADLSPERGEEALLAASAAGNTRSAVAVLETVGGASDPVEPPA